MEKLILIIAIVIISLLHSWWKKRKGEGDEDAAACYEFHNQLNNLADEFESFAQAEEQELTSEEENG